jgi:hypothetical protein
MNIALCLRLDSLSFPGGEGRGKESKDIGTKIPSPQPSPRLGGAREKYQL